MQYPHARATTTSTPFGATCPSVERGAWAGPVREGFAADVYRGLSLPLKAIPCMYLYDQRGSALFQQITEQPEYYPTGCEAEIFRTQGAEIGGAFDAREVNLVELGAGDGSKTMILLQRWAGQGLDLRYVPVDCSPSALRTLTEKVSRRFPKVRTREMAADFGKGLRWLSGQRGRRNVVLFLGSTLGNFYPEGQEGLLRNIWKAMDHGDLLLIGLDLVKDPDILDLAYNDAEGITEAFNLNLLHRINRELGGHFDPDTFRFRGSWDPLDAAVKSCLISRHHQQVSIEDLGRSFRFETWEPIHTESSYKFTLPSIQRIAKWTGFQVVETFLDERGYFADSLWRAHKPADEPDDAVTHHSY